ncbi:glycosyltransferase family protein [Spartinivicinus poritis]|uniref:Glycosyltransferase n=1 Tax=Spartinivicinus poritis TaxID=2994640 RepID=A0ABT5UBT3_9GAMM|nr:glycosyltransferase [Spartinivicinus sp. A2-2]MDE1463441.1 glycosyltransferase [Spartinivicinus sp. A2-2]
MSQAQPLTKPRRLFFYVQHLLGIGHLQRAARICQAAIKAGWDVFVVAGGKPITEIDFGAIHYRQLPVLTAADANFSQLVQADGRVIDEAIKQQRTQQLLHYFQQIQPDVVLLEMYPFGRRQFRFELIPLLDACHQATPAPVIVSSIRDVLVEKHDMSRHQWAVQQLQDYVDHVLVHGDPQLITLDQTFPLTGQIANKISYTGYIAPASEVREKAINQPPSATVPQQDILVSAGGGAVGFELLQLAQATCHQLNQQPEYRPWRWRMITGPNIPLPQYNQLKKNCPANMAIELIREDFFQCLCHSQLSISQAGYNTLLDTLQAGCQTIWVPFANETETEQRFRAQQFSQVTGFPCLDQATLTVQQLADTICQLLSQPVKPHPPIQMDGAAKTIQQLEYFLAGDC